MAERYRRALVRHLKIILSILFLTTFFRCSESQSSKNERGNRQQLGRKNDDTVSALTIASRLDSISIRTFYEWGFGERGNLEIYVKHKDTSFINYGCHYIKNNDTLRLSIFDLPAFAKDFPFDFYIDTAKYFQVDFTKIDSTTIRVSAHNNNGQTDILNKGMLLSKLFKKANPFKHFKRLSDIKNITGIYGTFYRPDLGNFIQFYLHSQYVLTYLPDSLNLNPKFKDVWMKEFAKGKTIKKNWNLRKADQPFDNG